MTQALKFSMIRRWVGGAKQWLSEFLDSLPSNRSIVAVVVMGSAVRDRGHRRSDFDLLVIYQGKRPDIKAPLEVDIHLVLVDRAGELISQGHELICWALQFGSALYDPELFWHALEKSWAGRVPLPSASEARARGEKCLVRAVEMLELGDESAADDLVLSALTQFVRERLIKGGVFPASRPELPNQLRELITNNPLAQLLDDAMFGDSSPAELVTKLKHLQHQINGGQHSPTNITRGR
jgi:predicted nucleotidyltransferase